MRPSTVAKAGAAVALLGGVAALLWALPRLGVWFGGVQTGLKPHETAHFVVYASNPEIAQRTGDEGEAFVAAFVARWGARHGFAPPDPRVAIYLFDDHEGLSKHGLLKMGESLEYNGGYFSRGERVIALVKADHEGLRHELTHMMAALNWPGADLSAWFSEGQAQWHEAGVEGGLPDLAVARCRELFRTGSGIALTQLLDAEGRSFKSAGNAIVYSESAALFAWLALERKEALERLIELERKPGEASPAEFAAAVGEPLESIEAAWKAWVSQGR